MNAVKQLLARRRTYPYTNARVRAMRADLLTDQDYRKLAKMESAGIAEFLGNHGYDEEIEAFGADHEGEDLLERAVKRNLARTYQKLMRISPDEVQELLRIYYRKFDLWNLKLVLRHVARGREDDIEDLLMPTQELSMDALRQLLEYDTMQDVIDAIDRLRFLPRIADAVDDPDDLQHVEDVIDAAYYRRLVQKAGDAGTNSALFERFLHLEAAINNIVLILRMKRYGQGYDDIMERLVDIPRRQQIMDNRKLANTANLDEALDILGQEQFGAYIEDESLKGVAEALERYKLEKGIEMLHTDQLTVNPILGFMICKEIEARNLRMLIRAKTDDLGEEFIDQHLIKGVSR